MQIYFTLNEVVADVAAKATARRGSAHRYDDAVIELIAAEAHVRQGHTDAGSHPRLQRAKATIRNMAGVTNARTTAARMRAEAVAYEDVLMMLANLNTDTPTLEPEQDEHPNMLAWVTEEQWEGTDAEISAAIALLANVLIARQNAEG